MKKLLVGKLQNKDDPRSNISQLSMSNKIKLLITYFTSLVAASQPRCELTMRDYLHASSLVMKVGNNQPANQLRI